MKRLLVITALGLSLVGCGKKDSGDSTAKAEGQDDGEIVEGGAEINPNPAAPGAPQSANAGGLIAAAAEGDVAGVKKLLADGADVNQRDPQQSTALIAASTMGHAEVVRALIAAKADLNAKNRDGNTALMSAAFLCRTDSVKALLEAGADLNARNGTGSTVLQSMQIPWAAAKPIYDLLDAIIFKPTGNPLDYDRLEKTRPVIAQMLEEAGGNAGPAPAAGDDLFAAIAEGDLAAMRKLIADGADVNQRNAQTETPLMAAAYAGNTEALKLLIEAKADVNAKKNDGGTALLGAAFFAQPESLKALIAAGADTNVKGARGETPLSLVETPWAQMEPIYKFVRDVVKVPMDFDRIQADRPKCVAILKGEQAAPPKVNPGAGAGGLFTAVAAGDLEAITKQLDGGVDVNAKEPAAGSTPLMLAAMSGQVAAAKLLIERGADVKAKNTDGNTALHTAAFFCKAGMVTLLLEKGADVNAKNSDGETALGSVSTPWAEAKGVYELLGGLLQLQLDLKAIETSRPKIAAQLRAAGGK